jgi:hypothetical protein
VLRNSAEQADGIAIRVVKPRRGSVNYLPPKDAARPKRSQRMKAIPINGWMA